MSLIRIDPVTPKKEEEKKKNKKVTRNIQLPFPNRPSQAKKEKEKGKNKIVTRNVQLSFSREAPVSPKKGAVCAGVVFVRKKGKTLTRKRV